MAKRKMPTIENEVIEPIVENTPVMEEATCLGKVTNCIKLNVRSKPDVTAKVLCEINKDETVEIDPNSTSPDFYKVKTSFGVKGYCMKKYIAIQK